MGPIVVKIFPFCIFEVRKEAGISNLLRGWLFVLLNNARERNCLKVITQIDLLFDSSF